MIFGFGKGRRDDDDDDDDELDQEFVLFQGSLNGEQPDLAKNARLAEAGLVPAKQMVSDAIRRRAESIRVEPKGNATIVALLIDGMKYSGGKMPKQRGLAVTQILKLLSGLDVKQRTKPQSGGVKAEFQQTPYELRVSSIPTQGGERLSIQLTNLNEPLDKPDEMGFTQELKEKIRELTNDRRGCLLVCGPPQSGVSTFMRGVVLCIDSYLYLVNFIADTGGRDLGNVSRFETNPEDDLEATITRAARAEVDCLYVDPIRDPETAQLLFQLQEKCALLAEFTARDAPTGIAQLCKWVGDPAIVAEGLNGILSQKLIRRLCNDCKQAFRPNPKLLAKMGLPPETKVLYRPPRQDAEDYRPCRSCGGVGFRGRAPLFELIEVNDEMKELVAGGAGPADIKALARKLKMPSIQREGLKLVASGVTSLEELQRAFKAQ